MDIKMNYLWAGMIVLGIVYSAFAGTLSEVTAAAVDSSKEAVTLCISMAGVIALWTGLMRIAERSGIIDALSRRMEPFMTFLFPRIPKDHPARKYIASNMAANIFGLGWAATPAGLKAMKVLDEELTDEEAAHGKIATPEMCTFLIINISSLQLIPVSIIAYRSQYGSVNPAAIIGPGLIATLCSTLAAVLFCKIMQRK